ncbi:MAG: deoxyribose-phosphate aldolase [Acidobacteria bacterium]|nr:deoxyribose-phosphate aldolase [Acidobacteriota bacterium]
MSENEPNLPARVAAAIDHTLLTANAERSAIEQLCHEALDARFAAVCVNPTWVTYCRDLLDKKVAVATVIGFPLGATDQASKADEARRAITNGADELDVVINIGRFISGDIDVVVAELDAIATLGTPFKVIIECAYLDDDQKRAAARAAIAAGAAFVKTSTGFAPSGATVADVALLHEIAHPAAAVKASGGIRDAATALAMLDAGATRLGTSASMTILDELTER